MINVWILRLASCFFLLVVLHGLVGATSDDVKQYVEKTTLKITNVIQKGRCLIEKAEHDMDQGISDAEHTLRSALHDLKVMLKEAECRSDVDENCLQEKQGRARTIHVKIIEKCRDHSELDTLQNRLSDAKKDITSSFEAAVGKCQKIKCSTEDITACVQNAVRTVKMKLREVYQDVSLTTDKVKGDVNHCAYSTANNYLRQIDAIRETLQKCVNESTSREQLIAEIESRLSKASKDVAYAVSRNTHAIKNANVPIHKCISEAIASVDKEKAKLEELVTNLVNHRDQRNEHISRCVKKEKAAIAKVNSHLIRDCKKCSQVQSLAAKITDLESLNGMIATATTLCRKLQWETGKVEDCVKKKIAVVEDTIARISRDVTRTVALSVDEACRCARDQSRYLIRKIQRIRRDLLRCVRK